MDLFDGLSVVSLGIAQTEESLLQDITAQPSVPCSGRGNQQNRILFLVPERKGDALECM